jgi:hypothetical protein
VRLRAISIAAKPRTAIVINITVLAGMCVRNSIISLQTREREKKKRPRKGGVGDLRE